MTGDEMRVPVDSTTDARVTLTPADDVIRLRLDYPGGDSVWQDWTPEQAQAIRNGLTSWLDQRAEGKS